MKMFIFITSMLSLEDGEFLIKCARNAIKTYLEEERTPKVDAPKKLLEKRGVFVTLEEYPSKELRGCIGYPQAVKPLAEAVVDSAINAAFFDSRFEPLTIDESKKCTIEISVLTEPEIIKVNNCKEYPQKIKVGKDGLIIECRESAGLLLPIVPVEQKWDEEEFLSHICYKAGLPPDSWLNPKAKLYKFQSQIFAEETPNGKVKEIKLEELMGKK
jgi:hypothetical protein